MFREWKIWIASFVVLLIVLAVGSIYHFINILTTEEKLVVATTTSLYDTGLLDVVENQFELGYSIDLYFISVGTGLALQHARRGDADMILVHAPSVEFSFLTEGHGVCRKIIAYNFFIIIGPEEDPADIEGSPPLDALKRIVGAGRNGRAVWISRGDESGTHVKEKGLWRAAGFSWEELRDEFWYREAGAGMGRTLQIANEFSAYTLTDVGTYLKYRKEGLIDLAELVGVGKELLNVYSAIAVNPIQHPHVNLDGAITFIKFLVSDKGQQIIGNYGRDQYGQSLFYPAVELLEENTNPTIADWIREYAYFNGTECPPEYRNDHPELYGQMRFAHNS